jgi:hypothetical protein
MKVVLALHQPGAFRSFEGVVRRLCQEGHEVKVLHGVVPKPIAVDRALRACEAEEKGCSTGFLMERSTWRGLANVRELVNCTNYLRPGHPAPGQANRWRNKVNRPLRYAIKNQRVLRFLSRQRIQGALKRIEMLVPPDPEIMRWLENYRPHVVVASPFIFPVSKELEYIKAAKALSIPTVGAVLSWDNLTSKGTFHVIPDVVLVWNESLAREAVALHDVPRNKIAVTGAPPFDFWFEMGPSVDRAAFCGRLGLNPHKPFVLYLCSSPFIARDETSFVKQLADALNERTGRGEIGLMVRPHPTNSAIWDGFEDDRMIIWPRGGEYVDVPHARQNYYDSIYYSSAVMGVNTSAMVETTILDKPCLTVMNEHYKATQTGVGHFRHLMGAGFMEVAASFKEASDILAQIVSGNDGKGPQRLRFVEEFIRPRGIGRPASEIMARIIAAVASGMDLKTIKRDVTKS